MSGKEVEVEFDNGPNVVTDEEGADFLRSVAKENHKILNAKMKIAQAKLAVTKVVASGFPKGIGDEEYLDRLTPTQDNLNAIEAEARKDERAKFAAELAEYEDTMDQTTFECLRSCCTEQEMDITSESYDCDEHGRHEGFLCPDCGKGGKTITESFID